MRLRQTPTISRRLTDEQRRQLRRRLAAVPHDATRDTPAVKELIDYYATFDIPLWVHGHGDIYIRGGGNIAAGLASMRRVLDMDDWGIDPSLPCDCAGCQRRALHGVHHSFEEYKRLGLFCERRRS